MKHFAALFLLVLLLFSSMTKEEAFVAPDIPDFTDSYGLAELYADLQADWGAPHRWTLEQKAWLSQQNQVLLNKEVIRCQPLNIEVETSYLQPLSNHRHGLPEDDVIDQATALSMAVNHLSEQGFDVTEEMKENAGFFYLLDDPAHPLWWFTFDTQPVPSDTYMDARTGQFTHCATSDLLGAAKAYLPLAPTLIARQPVEPDALDSYDITACYQADKQQWYLALYHQELNHELVFWIDDAAGTVVDFDAANG